MMTHVFPQIPLKEMDAAQLVFELSRQVESVVVDPDGLVMSAAMIATHLHRHQTRGIRKDLPRTPYIEHPMRNALRAIRFGKTDPHLIAACLLHDVIEDCSGWIAREFVKVDDLPGFADLTTMAGRREASYLWLAANFGVLIADTVLEVTNKQNGSRQDYWMKLAMLGERVQGTVPDPVAVMALIVKAMDLIDNAGSLRHQLAQGEKWSLIYRRADKYRPAVSLVSAGLRHAGEAAIADYLDELEGHLDVIISKYAANAAKWHR